MQSSQASASRAPEDKKEGYGTERCNQCKAHFPTWEKLMQHKAEKYVPEKSHIHCETCGRDFHTERAKLLHARQFHPYVLYLECPGCRRGPYQRASALVEHIEKGQCTRINSNELEEARKRKLLFVQKLKTITNEPVKMDFTAYLPSVESQSPALAASEWDYNPEAEAPKFLDTDFPLLSGQQPQWRPDAPPGSVGSTPMTEEDIAAEWWNGTEPLFANAVLKKPTPKALQAATAPSARDVYEAQDIHHPSHRQFNVGRYKNEITDRWDCPKDFCFKAFKTASQLIGHLRSPVHEAPKYQCPCCKNKFHSVAATLCHAENPSTSCALRNANEFGAFIAQLTGGIIDLCRKENDDGTPIFEVSRDAKKLFGNKQKSIPKSREIDW